VHTRKFKFLIAVLVISALFLLVITSRTVTNPSRAGLTNAVSPGLSVLNSISKIFKKIIPFASLRDERDVLKQKVAFLSRRIEETASVYSENLRLKELLNFKAALPYATIPAQVIGRDPSSWSSSVIINKGYLDGIRNNRAVISARGLVGRVAEVGKRSSKIMLITDLNSKVGVVITRNRQGGILTGRPDGKCRIMYIALDSDVAPGDKVMTAGLGNIFPKDILAGEVAGTYKEPGRLYKCAIVKTAQDLSKLEEVLCIR